MTRESSVQHLLRWRIALAEAEAPPPPRAARLLERARPWWEIWPDRLRSRIERLHQIQVTYGYAMANPPQSRGGHAVPALVVRDDQEVEALVRVLYLSVREGRLRLRFHLDAPPPDPEPGFEVTFVPEAGVERPLFAASASVSDAGEYRLETQLPSEIAEHWGDLKVTDRMPFRFVLHSRARET